MKTVRTIVLENGIEYIVIDSINYKNIEYLFFINEKDSSDSCIRKIQIINNENYICKLDNKKEYDMILNKFREKNKALF